jgi:hypothetical protein
VTLRAIRGTADRGPILSAALLIGSFAILALSVTTGAGLRITVPVVLVLMLCALAYRHILTWPVLIEILLIVILFIPIRRYSLPGGLPFELEPYRLLVAFVGVGWLASLLVDPRVKLRRTGLGGPLFAISFAYLFSVAVNTKRISDLGLGTDVAKTLTFFFSFLIVVFFIVSLVRSEETLDRLIRVLVGGGAILACFALYEAISGQNLFNRLGEVIPVLRLEQLPTSLGDDRGGRLRVYASAEHPIALGAALVILIPLGIYLARTTRQRRWWASSALLLFGALATQSRTAVVMLLVVALVYLRLRPVQTRRLWPALLPGLLAIHIILPGTLGTLKESFFPKGGLIAQQSDASVGSGRIATLGPALTEASKRPLLGLGYGSRVVGKGVFTFNGPTVPILDDQWLGTLLDAGILGVLAWTWLFVRFYRRMSRAAKDDDGPTGWLYTGLAASIAGYAIGMFTFDAFGFIQVTILMFILLGIGSVAHLSPESPLQQGSATRAEARDRAVHRGPRWAPS